MSTSIGIEKQLDMTFQALHTFFDWRYRILTRFMIMVGAVLGSWSWLNHKNNDLRASVLFAASGLSLVLLLSDRVNDSHIRHLYKLGSGIEGNQIDFFNPGVFATIEGTGAIAVKFYGKKRRLKYGAILETLYFISTAVFLGLALALLWGRPQ